MNWAETHAKARAAIADRAGGRTPREGEPAGARDGVPELLAAATELLTEAEDCIALLRDSLKRVKAREAEALERAATGEKAWVKL